MNLVQRVREYFQYGQGATYSRRFLLLVRRLWSQLQSSIRSLLSQLSPQPLEERQACPASVRCTEIIRYDVAVGRRTDCFPGDVVGKIQVRVPYTVTHIPWARTQALKYQTPINVGFLGFWHYAEAGLLSEKALERLPHRDLYADRVTVPLHLTAENLLDHMTLGDEAVLEFTYQPQLSVDFPVSLEAELTDVPLLDEDTALYANVPTTFLDDLCLRIKISGEVSNLSQQVEQGIVEWVERGFQRAREEYDAWRQILDALEGEGEQGPGALQQVARTLGGRNDIPEGVLQKAGLETVPSLAEARAALREVGSLLQYIRAAREGLRSAEGALSTEDVADAIKKARQASGGPPTERNDRWLERLERQARLEGTHLRYIAVEWPFPEPTFDWLERSNPLQILDQGWTYNPERRLMERYDVPLRWRAKEQRFEAIVELPLSRPPEHQLSGGPLHVRGRLVMETERLLSGLHVVWLDENKRKAPRSDKIVSLQTEIHVGFEVDLEAAFRQRTVWARRRLLFEGILPSKERPREVEHILSNAGLTVLPNRRLREGSTAVRAIWREAGLPTEFSAVLQGNETTDQHTLSFDQERQRVERNVRGGSLRVDLWVRGGGDPGRTLNKLDDIQARLQERWSQGDSSVWQGTCFKEV